MDEGLKVRLVGALVLLSLLAIAWPLIFDDADEIKLSQQSQIPVPPAVEKWQAAERSRPEQSPTTRSSPSVVEPAESTDATPEPAPTPASREIEKQAQSPVPMREAWVVRVASLSDIDNGDKLVKKLLTDGYRAYGRVSETETGSLMRVYIGPKFDKRKADSIKLKIDKHYSVKSMVVPYQADAA